MVSRADRIGDLVLTLPAIGWLKKSTGAHVTLHCSFYARDIGLWAKHNGIVDELIWREDPDSESFVGVQPPYTHALSFFHCSETRDLFRLTRPGVSFGPRTKLSAMWCYSKTLAQHRSQVAMSEMQYNVELAKAALKEWKLNAIEFSGLPKLRVPVEWTANVDMPRGIVVSLSNGGSAGNWSVQDYLRWVKENAPNEPIDFLVAGLDASSRKQELKAWDGFDSTRHRIVETLNSVGNLVAYLSRAKRLVASSTGPLHVAHAAGVDVLGIYPIKKVESFKRWRPDGYWHDAEVRWIEITP